MSAIYWLGLFLILLIIEIATMGLTTIWFAGGALVAFAASALGIGVIGQFILFVVVSLALLIGTRPIAIKYFNKGREKTNAESLIGQEALIIETIDSIHGTGRVAVNGLEWAAKTEQPELILAVDGIVVIKGIQGVKLVVEKKVEGK